ncbi:MAG TPA: response regulator [Thermodesulfobacteriota bacterium]|nr:response regulator [Thermodesulfobacteriota bacterium]
MNSKGSILIVEDEAGVRESLRVIFEPTYEVHVAGSGREAIDFVTRNKVDLVTLDLGMPGLTGMEVLRELKKLQPDIEIVIVTGNGTLGIAREAVRFAAGDFISKPFKVADILSVVSKALRRRRGNLELMRLDPSPDSRQGSSGGAAPHGTEFQK